MIEKTWRTQTREQNDAHRKTSTRTPVKSRNGISSPARETIEIQLTRRADGYSPNFLNNL